MPSDDNSNAILTNLLKPLATISTCTLGGALVGLAQTRQSATVDETKAAPQQRRTLKRPAVRGAASGRGLTLTWSVCCFAFSSAYEIGKVAGGGVREAIASNVPVDVRLISGNNDLKTFTSTVADSMFAGGIAGLVASRVTLPVVVSMRLKSPVMLVRYGVLFGILGGMAEGGVKLAEDALRLMEEEENEDGDEVTKMRRELRVRREPAPPAVEEKKQHPLDDAADHLGAVANEMEAYLKEKEGAKNVDKGNKGRRWWRFW